MLYLSWNLGSIEAEKKLICVVVFNLEIGQITNEM